MFVNCERGSPAVAVLVPKGAAENVQEVVRTVIGDASLPWTNSCLRNIVITKELTGRSPLDLTLNPPGWAKNQFKNVLIDLPDKD